MDIGLEDIAKKVEVLESKVSELEKLHILRNDTARIREAVKNI